ncbi:methyltransferase domain-containing protein [Benzoatithermus flavus]|uniref:Methyltransferase domain-containing protein n=1 Tax=Benzoatithermus flavus TaxID=3108223 RepID=A0ABU8XYQ3_9PROT
MTDRMRIFDRNLVRQRRARFARDFGEAGFLVAEVAGRLIDRLEDIRRSFPRVLVLGGQQGVLERALAGRFGIELLVTSDTVPGMLESGNGLAVVADEEALPFGPDRFDAVLSVMLLHWVNDLPGVLVQLRTCLKPDGLLLLALPGGETLFELRQCLLQAELEMEDGASPRVSPMTDVRDAGGLLQRAGLALPVVDVDRITITYADPLRLMRELSRMGEGNALLQRRPGPLRRATLARACQLYVEQFGDADGRVPATLDILFLTAWKPHPSQPKPKPRGSATVSLIDALKAPPANDGSGG